MRILLSLYTPLDLPLNRIRIGRGQKWKVEKRRWEGGEGGRAGR